MGRKDQQAGRAEALKKSDRTRAAIMEAARLLFREFGYERTTVRDIASRAEVDPALVIRYFGSKEQLFCHSVEIRLDLPDVSVLPCAEVGPALARHFLLLWDEGADASGLPILLRSAASNETAAALMRQVFQDQVATMFQRVLPAEDALVRAGLVSSLLFGVALTRHILKLPPIAELSPEELVEKVGYMIQSCLPSPVPAAVARSQ